MIADAILTQNTAWVNIARALANLRRAEVLTPAGLAALPRSRLAPLIPSAGYYNTKAARLRSFLDFLASGYRLSLTHMFAQPASGLWAELLAVPGIGPEQRILFCYVQAACRASWWTLTHGGSSGRQGLSAPGAGYSTIQALFTEALPQDAALYNEYHLLLVAIGKAFCRPLPG